MFNTWDSHPGIFTVIPDDLDFNAMHTHFQRFLRVSGLDNPALYFRYYDPRVMSEYLPGFHAAFAPETRHEMVKNGRHKVLEYSFKDPVSQAHFITLMWHIGSGFHHFPGFQDIARATRQSGPERINDFYHVSAAHWNHAVQHTDDRHWFSETAE